MFRFVSQKYRPLVRGWRRSGSGISEIGTKSVCEATNHFFTTHDLDRSMANNASSSSDCRTSSLRHLKDLPFRCRSEEVRSCLAEFHFEAGDVVAPLPCAEPSNNLEFECADLIPRNGECLGIIETHVFRRWALGRGEHVSKDNSIFI